MNIINSVTGLNMNFNLGGNMGNFNNPQNINIQGNYNFNGDEDDMEDDGDYDENEADEENEEDENNLEQIFIKKKNRFILELDEFQYKHLKKYSTFDDNKCRICLQKYKGADIIKEFPCKHIFHKVCILKRIKNSNKCPLCNFDITEEVNKVVLESYNDEDDDE